MSLISQSTKSGMFSLMIRCQRSDTTGPTKVTFALADQGVGASLIADINGWDRSAHPLKKRSNGTRSVSLSFDPGTVVRFRYALDNGEHANDPDADAIEPNDLGTENAVLVV